MPCNVKKTYKKACGARVVAPQGARISSPVRAYERSEWRSAGCSHAFDLTV